MTFTDTVLDQTGYKSYTAFNHAHQRNIKENPIESHVQIFKLILLTQKNPLHQC